MSKDAQTWWLDHAVTILIAILVGMGSSYMTVRTTVTELKERVTQNRNEIVRLRESRKQQSEGRTEIKGRLIRLETKLDILLKNSSIDKGKIPGSS